MDITQITPNLYVGSNPTRSDALQIARAGITHVVDLRGEPIANGLPPETAEPEIWAGTGVRYLYVPMHDNGRMIPASLYATAVDAIASAIRAGGKVLVHCSAGHYRSPSVAYAYLRKTGLSPSAAWDLVARRPGASRQYLTSAERYLNPTLSSTGATTDTGGKTPTSGPVGPSIPKMDGGSNAGLWLAFAAIGLGVVALMQSRPRHNPGPGLPPSLRPFADKIVDAYQERDGSDLSWWVHLAPGWCWEPGSHTIHEPTLKQAVARLRGVDPCDCEQCSTTRG